MKLISNRNLKQGAKQPESVGLDVTSIDTTRPDGARADPPRAGVESPESSREGAVTVGAPNFNKSPGGIGVAKPPLRALPVEKSAREQDALADGAEIAAQFVREQEGVQVVQRPPEGAVRPGLREDSFESGDSRDDIRQVPPDRAGSIEGRQGPRASVGDVGLLPVEEAAPSSEGDSFNSPPPPSEDLFDIEPQDEPAQGTPSASEQAVAASSREIAIQENARHQVTWLMLRLLAVNGKVKAADGSDIEVLYLGEEPPLGDVFQIEATSADMERRNMTVVVLASEQSVEVLGAQEVIVMDSEPFQVHRQPITASQELAEAMYDLIEIELRRMGEILVAAAREAWSPGGGQDQG
jgi:hypothetical protein